MAVRGRTLYRIAEPILLAIALVLRLFPRVVSSALLAIFRHFPGRAGIAIRYVFVKRLAKKCGRCVAVFEGVHLLKLEHIEFGDNVSIHPMCYLDGSGGLSIGNDVSIAHASTVMTTEHDFAVPGCTTRDAPCLFEPVHIADDVWMGCGVRVLAGCDIGTGAVIGAGAVVTRAVEASTVNGGVPAKVIREIGEPSEVCKAA